MTHLQRIAVLGTPVLLVSLLAGCAASDPPEPASPQMQAWEKAHTPELPDGVAFPSRWATLSWVAGSGADSHDIYLGDNFDEVNRGTGGTFRGNQLETRFVIGFQGYPYPNGLASGTTYYWRIDEVNDTLPNIPCRGDVWSFTVVRN